MTLHSLNGVPALFELQDADLDAFSERERRILIGALNFHALMAPEQVLDVQLYDGGVDDTPRTTDDTTFSGMSRRNRTRIGALRARSTVTAEKREHSTAEEAADVLISAGTRHLHISRDDVLLHDPVRPARTDIVGRVARRVKAAAPLWYDQARDLVLLRHSGALRRPVDRQDYEAQFEADGMNAGGSVVPVGKAIEGARKAVLIGLHWFELGGAERWAFETVRLVRDAGFLPIVLTNRDSHQPWITRAELDGALLIPFSEPTVESQTPGVEQLLRGLLRNFDVRGVVVHHNQWLYDRLAWILRSRPGLPVVDSTHIVEYRGGGYPLSSAMVSNSITRHHVISPSLAKWMIDVQGIPSEKVVMAPLGGLTVKPKEARFRPKGAEEPFVVAFVGRMARQKAPETFAAMVRKLGRDGGNYRFIMHGDGELSSWMDDVIDSMGLSGRIERRTSETPVPETLDESHLLVVSSHNEGLTLTTLEAITHGLPVISTDVGAQSDLIPASGLVPRDVHRAASGLAKTVAALARDEAAREALWRSERKAEKKLLGMVNANEWFAGEVAAW